MQSNVADRKDLMADNAMKKKIMQKMKWDYI